MSAESESVEANAVDSLPNAVRSDGAVAPTRESDERKEKKRVSVGFSAPESDEALLGKAKSLDNEEDESPIPSSRSLRRSNTTRTQAGSTSESVECRKNQLKFLAQTIDNMYANGTKSGSSDKAEIADNADSSKTVKGDSQRKVKVLGQEQVSQEEVLLPVSNGKVSSEEVLSDSAASKETPRRNSHGCIKPSTTTLSTLLDPLDPESQGRVTKQHWSEAIKNVFQREPGTPWIHSVLADCCFGFVILLNAGYIAVESEVGEQEDSQNEGVNVNSGWFMAETTFLCIFTIELSLRIQAERKRFVYSAWNVFDAVLVFNGLLDFVTTLLLTGGTGLNFLTFARILRLLRIMRILRLLRILRFLRELILLIQGILGALKALSWALVLLLLIIMMCSLLVTKTLGKIEHDDPEHDEQIQLYFGSFLKSSFTLLTLMTLDEWSITARWVVFEVSPVHGFFLIIYILITHYTLVNLVTGIILENIMRLAKSEEDRQRQAEEEARRNLIQRVQKVFTLIDTNGDGELSVEEFMQGLEDPRIFYLFKSIGLKVWEAVELFSLMDVENVGCITVDAFAEGCYRWQGPAQSRDLLALQYDMHRAIGRLDRRHHPESSDSRESIEPPKSPKDKTSSDLAKRIAAIEAQNSKIEAQNSRIESTLSKMLEEMSQQRSPIGPTTPCASPPQMPCSSNLPFTRTTSDEHLSKEVGELLDTDLFTDPASPRHVNGA